MAVSWLRCQDARPRRGRFYSRSIHFLYATQCAPCWKPSSSPRARWRWLLALSFVAMAAWMLFPDSASDFEGSRSLGVFGTTLVTFFLVEIGDKTQLATVALAAHYDSFIAVVLGTTTGMLAANVPV